MVEMSIVGDQVTFEVLGWHKLWALKSRITVPASHIRSARIDPERARVNFEGIRAPGTAIPGILRAGTFYSRKGRTFWDVTTGNNAIVVDLVGGPFDELVVDVSDPRAAVAQLQRIAQA